MVQRNNTRNKANCKNIVVTFDPDTFTKFTFRQKQKTKKQASIQMESTMN